MTTQVEKRKAAKLICYGCNGVGHVKADCPNAPKKRKKAEFTLFVSNLTPGTTEDELWSLFYDYWPVRVHLHQSGVVAFVSFEGEEEARAALADLEGSSCHYTILHLAWAEHTLDRMTAPAPTGKPVSADKPSGTTRAVKPTAKPAAKANGGWTQVTRRR